MTSRRGPEIPSILVVVSVYTGIGDALVHGDRRGVGEFFQAAEAFVFSRMTFVFVFFSGSDIA